MLGFLGESVLLGLEGAAPNINNVSPIRTVELRNGKFEYFHATKDQWEDMPTLPIQWIGSTIMDAQFQNNINAGNAGYFENNLKGLVIQRVTLEEIGEEFYPVSDWTTILEVSMDGEFETRMSFKDVTNASNKLYRYRIIPIIEEDGVEKAGNASISDIIESHFDGVFICDKDDFVKLYEGVEYGQLQTIQVTGVHQGINSKYPIIVANSKTNYHVGGLSGTVINDEFRSNSANIDERKIIEKRKYIDKVLTSKSPKIIKDYAGNIWLVVFTSEVNYDWFNGWGKSIGTVSVSWTEIGDAELEQDLRRTGFIKERRL